MALVQLTSCHGTELSCCTVRQEQEKLHCVAHSLKSSPYVFRIGKQPSELFEQLIFSQFIAFADILTPNYLKLILIPSSPDGSLNPES